MNSEKKMLHSKQELLEMLKKGYRFEWTGWSPKLNTVYLGHNPFVAVHLCMKDMGLSSDYFTLGSGAGLGPRTREAAGFDFEPGWGDVQFPVSVVFYSSDSNINGGE
tara:strand:- start:11421 stop:11741 length:321 start_codon:yes stop_codon:yes gene_type:complete